MSAGIKMIAIAYSMMEIFYWNVSLNSFHRNQEASMIHAFQAENERLPVPAQNEEYQSYIVKYNQSIQGPIENMVDGTFLLLENYYAILYVPEGIAGQVQIDSYSYQTIPKCFTYMDLESLAASNVLRLHNHPYLSARGRGTLIAVIDSGIDYTHPVFRDTEFGADIPVEGLPGMIPSKIRGIWDQTVTGDFRNPDPDMAAGNGSVSVLQQFAPYGRVYSNEEINRALASEDPYAVVPSRDEDGHGTMLASIAAGRLIANENFSGAAPEAALLIIKLKPAKQYLKDFYLLPEEAQVYQEDDIMAGAAFAIQCAKYYQMPLSICIGLGTSQGAHLGQGALAQYLTYINGFPKNAVSLAAGNEGAARHHFGGRLEPGEGTQTVELRVGERTSGFAMEFWGETPEEYLVSLQSPIGETLEICSSLGAGDQELSFIFVETRVLVNYVEVESRTGNTLIFFRFFSPASGIWRFQIRGRGNRGAAYHLWLPVQRLLSEDTFFLASTPDTTITAPGDSIDSMTATAYRARDNSLYVEASRGYLADGAQKPVLAFPGVDVKAAVPGGGYAIASGTSMAAAQCAGISALLQEWAIIKENDPYYNGNSVRHDLVRGAVQNENRPYPNADWGYGRADLYRTFESLGY